MNRDELLTNFAMELSEWPVSAEPYFSHEHKDIFFREEWLNRRADLINKPSWGDAPEWAEWLAQAYCGTWEWSSKMPPRQSVTGFDIERNSRHMEAADGSLPAGHDWRQTLERRPQFDEERIDTIGQNGNDGYHYEVTAEEDEAFKAMEKRSKYHREIKPGVFVDVYDVLKAWGVKNPAIQHLIKKALMPGERGHKPLIMDMNEIVASAERARELEDYS